MEDMLVKAKLEALEELMDKVAAIESQREPEDLENPEPELLLEDSMDEDMEEYDEEPLPMPEKKKPKAGVMLAFMNDMNKPKAAPSALTPSAMPSKAMPTKSKRRKRG